MSLQQVLSLPQGMSLQQGISLPEGMSLPQGMSLPLVISLPQGMSLPQVISLPQGLSLPQVISLPQGLSLPQGISASLPIAQGLASTVWTCMFGYSVSLSSLSCLSLCHTVPIISHDRPRLQQPHRESGRIGGCRNTIRLCTWLCVTWRESATNVLKCSKHSWHCYGYIPTVDQP